MFFSKYQCGRRSRHLNYSNEEVTTLRIRNQKKETMSNFPWQHVQLGTAVVKTGAAP